ncbi:MAG: TonB-dependent receptor [Pseudomonadales bacterium]
MVLSTRVWAPCNRPLKITSCKFYRRLLIALAASIGNSFCFADTRHVTLEEVIVTSQQRVENLQDVPIAISVYNTTQLDRLGANTLAELAPAIPSINFGQGGRSSRGEISIRGVGDYSRNIGSDARVAVYVDGVLTGRSSSFNQYLHDIERVEVLRGPQGTLFGKNTLSGAINITTLKPNKQFKASLQTESGNYRYRSHTVQVNTPITQQLYSSLQLGITKRDGFIDNITLDRDLQGINRQVGRLKLRYLPNDRLEINISADGLNEDIHATNAVALADGGFTGFTTAPDARKVAHDTPEFEKRRYWGGALTSQYVGETGYQFETITAYRETAFSELSEEDYSPLDVASSLFDEDNEQWSQEFRLLSPQHDAFDYIVGLYYLDQNISTQRYAETGENFIIPNAKVTTPAAADTRSVAVYMHGNYSLSQQWKINGGLRYTKEDKRIDYRSIDSTGLFINAQHKDSTVLYELSPKLGLAYHANNRTLLYSSISRGFKSGGWNADFLSTLDNIKFDPEYATSLEIGVKSTSLDQLITLNIAGFITKFKDFQVFQFVPTANNGTILALTNASKVTSRGIEVETVYILSDALRFSASLAYVDAAFDRFKHGGGIGIHYDNNQLPYAPDFSSHLAIDYQKAISQNTEFFTHISYNYSDGYYSNPNNRDAYTLDSYDIVNAKSGIVIDKKWHISLWAKNLLDETYLRQRTVSFLGVPRGYYETPRTYGLSVKYLFR